jgi:mannose-1-phosphate guanylyltransferase/mannose-6-phosphate isomerase
MTEPIIPLIMCGGAGTRLWPASREGRPKQFLRLFGPRSTFQETLRRVGEPSVFGRPIIVTNHQYRFLVAEQLAEIGIDADILLEPHRRDSAPAIVAGAVHALRRGEAAVVLALAADHVVTDVAGFVAACRTARAAAQGGHIVTFGVTPDRPATEYGYIRRGKSLLDGVFAAEKFVEKPDEATARAYVGQGYLWNSGNLMFGARCFLDEYRGFDAASAAAVTAAVEGAGSDLGFITLKADDFARATAKSVDYAVMEKTTRAAVVPVSYGWSDVGSWQAVWDLADKDTAGNASQGTAVFVDSKSSYAASDKALVSLFGVENLVVISSEDAVLVANRHSVDGMRQLVQRLKEVAPKITEDHLQVHRPWGYYHSLDNGTRYQVKRIMVKPGGRLSLQLHHHRSEHWVIVRGTAQVTVGNDVKTVHENESIYIPIGSPHRLENPGKIDLELIEVQTGSYLGEDDIVRIEDDYRRS